MREQAEGIAASEEELLLLGLFGEDAERLLLGIRGRARGDGDELAAVDKARAERIREVVRIVQETGIGEVTIEEDGMRVTVRATADAPAVVATRRSRSRSLELARAGAARERRRPRRVADGRHLLPRRRSPGAPPFVEEGDVVAAGQTLCILEAMKLMNEVKAEHRGRRPRDPRRRTPSRSSSGSCSSTSSRSPPRRPSV